LGGRKEEKEAELTYRGTRTDCLKEKRSRLKPDNNDIIAENLR